LRSRIQAPVRALSGVVVWLLAVPAFACLNTFASNILEARGTGNAAAQAAILADAEKAYRESPTLESTNDLAVAYIVTGRGAEGIQLLRDLENRQPGNAKVAANLGTALELAGSDQEALLWIRESVRRDPREHEGSEWVHVRILEAKLALKRDSNWLRTRSVVGWRDGQQLLADERGLVRSPMDLIAPITYQLKERTQFVAAPDAVVGDLYLTLGDIAHSYPGAFKNGWERDGAESANYRSALHYGTVHEVRARSRMEDADERIEASRDERQAAARRGQMAQELADKKAERQRVEEQARADRRAEQQRRRQLALWVFVSLAAVLAGALLWRRKRQAA
jgi:hypothetical protein